MQNGKSTDVEIRSSQPIGEAITEGAGLYANEIMNTRDAMEREYGNAIKEVKLSLATFSDGDVLGASDGETVYMAKKYAQNTNMTEAMQVASKQGFHPKIGNKTGAEAVTAHEMGHVLGAKASAKAGISQEEIVARASKRAGIRKENMGGYISKYATYNYFETIAEASADVYCNGSKAMKASKAIMREIKEILG